MINLLKRVLSNYCENLDPDFDWNKNLKSKEKYDISNHGKYKNKSMIMNNKSTNSQIYNKDETAISPGILKNGNSIFKKEE